MLAAPVPADGAASPSPAASSAVAAVPTMPTRLLVEGSTGGAGLRGLEKEKATPLTLSVLYFDETHALKAYDDIQLGGTGSGGSVGDTLEFAVAGEQEPAVGDQPQDGQQCEGDDHGQDEDLPVLPCPTGGWNGVVSAGSHRLLWGSMGSSWRAVRVTWSGSSRRLGRSSSGIW